LVDCLAFWNEFKVNNILDIEESDEHCLHLLFRHLTFLVSCCVVLFLLEPLSFTLGIILKASLFISSDNF
jgi:hypothetical protein